MDITSGATTPYTEDKARFYFQQIILGFEYRECAMLFENALIDV